MSDNVTAPVTGKTFSTRDVSGVHHPRGITEYTDDATSNPIAVKNSTPMPVTTIPGQAGVAGGTGTVSSSTQRMTIATDDGLFTVLPASLGVKASSASFPVVFSSDQFAAESNAYPSAATMSTSAYAAGDVIGTLLTFTNMVTTAGNGFRIDTMLITEKTGTQRAALRLYLYQTNAVTVAADNAPFAPVDGDLDIVIGWIDCGPYDALNGNGNAVSVRNNIGLYGTTSGSTSIYGVVTAGPGATPTYGSTTDLRVRLLGAKDV